ncbi:GTP-binding protein, partial [Staphylococcus epidermidis]|uniref:GTP-binding protein n=1 Tax=Staphylococcus epidermidis TaxID=1282 RepID=UPI0037D9A9F2
MKLQQEPGISLTTSLIQFHYHHYNINILHTPPHQHFSHHTYPTLIPLHTTLMLIHCAKPIQPQTLKLF